MEENSGILLSGGMDSICLAYWKKPKYAFTINYGQKSAKSEIQAASQISKALGIEHHIISINCSKLGSGDLSNSAPLEIAPISEWWPYRNQLLITFACMKGVALKINKLYVGSVLTDGAHIDGTKEFYSNISKLIELQEGNISISVPAIDISTTDLIKKSQIPYSLLLWAHSCHTSNEPCMNCNGCKKYLYILQQLGID